MTIKTGSKVNKVNDKNMHAHPMHNLCTTHARDPSDLKV